MIFKTLNNVSGHEIFYTHMDKVYVHVHVYQNIIIWNLCAQYDILYMYIPVRQSVCWVGPGHMCHDSEQRGMKLVADL